MLIKLTPGARCCVLRTAKVTAVNKIDQATASALNVARERLRENLTQGLEEPAALLPLRALWSEKFFHREGWREALCD